MTIFLCYCFRGFLHAHVSYLSDSSPACLMLLSNDREKFFSLQESRQKIVAVSQLWQWCLIILLYCHCVPPHYFNPSTEINWNRLCSSYQASSAKSRISDTFRYEISPLLPCLRIGMFVASEWLRLVNFILRILPMLYPIVWIINLVKKLYHEYVLWYIDAGCNGLRHFIYKSKKTSCMTSPRLPVLYCDREQKERWAICCHKAALQ